MPVSYSSDFRMKIIEEIQKEKDTITKIADRFRVSRSFVYTLWSRFKETGEHQAKPRSGKNLPKLANSEKNK